MDPAVVTQIGKELIVDKLLLTSMQCLWIYDYLLTFGDEIRFAWSGRNSWVFALFVANRYTPILHLIWCCFTMFHYDIHHTKWIPTFHSGAVTVFAQTAIALRVYVITGKNKLLGCALALVIVVEFCSAMFCVVWFALGPLQPLPEVNLDPFKICIYKLWKTGELMYYVLAMLFDSLAFVIVAETARRSRIRGGGLVMPSLLDTILRDATQYFMFIFSAHLLSLIFLFVTPENVQLLPAMANTIFVPVMASRLMLSLKKAAAESKRMWSLDTMTNSSWREVNGSVRFAPPVAGESHGISLASTISDWGDMELAAVPSSKNHESSKMP